MSSRAAWGLLVVPAALVAFGIAAPRVSPHVGGARAALPAARSGGVGNDAVGGDAEKKDAEKKKVQLDQELVTVLYRVGLQPEKLAAGGVVSTLTDDVVVAVKTWIAQHPGTLSDVDQRDFDAVTLRDQLVRKVRSGLASQEEVSSCQSAIANATAVEAERKTTLQSVFNAGTVMLDPTTATLLSRIQQNALDWEVSLQFCVIDRTQEDWVALRDALCDERVALKRNEPVDPDEASLLATARANGSVATAKTNLDTTLGAVTAAWIEAASIQ